MINPYQHAPCRVTRPRHIISHLSTMKSVLSICLLCLSSVAWGEELMSAADVGVRVLINKGRSVEGGACTDDERRLIKRSLYNAVAGRRRLAGGRDLTSCSAVCQSFAGCYVAHPRCSGWRRLGAPEEKCSHLEKEDEEKWREEISKMQGIHLLESQEELAACENEKQLVNKVLDQAMNANLQPACRTVLQQSIDLECFKLD